MSTVSEKEREMGISSENVVRSKRYSESLKLEVLGELSKGDVSLSTLGAKYSIPVSTIATWSRVRGESSRESLTAVKGRVYMGEEDLKIRELESALAESLLKNKLYEKMFEYAKEDYGIELKKNAVTGQYSLVKKNTALPPPVKR